MLLRSAFRVLNLVFVQITGRPSVAGRMQITDAHDLTNALLLPELDSTCMYKVSALAPHLNAGSTLVPRSGT